MLKVHIYIRIVFHLLLNATSAHLPTDFHLILLQKPGCAAAPFRYLFEPTFQEAIVLSVVVFKIGQVLGFWKVANLTKQS